MTRAYAVKVDGEINIATVSPHERAAKVNGLVSLFGVMVYNSWSEEMISDEWTRCCGMAENVGKNVRVVPVEVLEWKQRELPPLEIGETVQ